MSQVIESIRHRIATIEVESNKIIHIYIDDNCEVELSDSKAQYEFLKANFDGIHKLRVYVEPGRYTSITKEARAFSARPQSNAMTLGTAVLVQTLAHRIIINFLIHILRQQNMKMRMFDKREKAIEWLLSLEQKEL